MKQQTTKLEVLVATRLAELGANRLPPAVIDAITADISKACSNLIRERIDRNYVGDMVTKALEATADLSTTPEEGAAQ